MLVADNVSAYFNLADRLFADREWAYAVRVSLFEVVDAAVKPGAGKPREADSAHSSRKVPSASASGTDAGSDSEAEMEGEGEDVGEFLVRVGLPWARLREDFSAAQANSRQKKTILF
jgi:hypothetical protein